MKKAQRWSAGLSDQGSPAKLVWDAGLEKPDKRRVTRRSLLVKSQIAPSQRRNGVAFNDENEGKRPRAKLTDEVVRIIRERLKLGHFQHDIAADLGINQGRVSEVNTGKRGGSQFGQASLF